MEKLKGMRIQLRRDTLDNWISANPVLGDGELAIVKGEDGDIQFKVGDGISDFKTLPYTQKHGISSDSVVAKDITARSIAQGYRVSAVPTSIAGGYNLSAAANFSQVFGINATSLSNDDFSFVWNADQSMTNLYGSHGEGTFSINPVNNLSGFYIGNENLQKILCDEVNIAIDYADEISNHISDDYYRKFETSSFTQLSDEFKKKLEIGDYSNEVLTFTNGIS